MQEVSLPEKQHWRRSSARLALKLAGRVLLCTARTTSTAEAIGAMGNTGEAGVGSPRLARVSHRNRGGAAIPLDATDSGAARTLVRIVRCCLSSAYCTFALGCHLQGGNYRGLVRGGCSRPKIRSGIRIRAQKQAESSG
jgi:hypothetical protein